MKTSVSSAKLNEPCSSLQHVICVKVEERWLPRGWIEDRNFPADQQFVFLGASSLLPSTGQLSESNPNKEFSM